MNDLGFELAFYCRSVNIQFHSVGNQFHSVGKQLQLNSFAIPILTAALLFSVSVRCPSARAETNCKQLLDRGIRLFDKHKFDEAIASLKAAEVIEHSNALVHLYLGHSYLQVGDNEQAIRELNKAKELQPNLFADTLKDQISAYTQTGKFAEAASLCAEARVDFGDEILGPWLPATEKLLRQYQTDLFAPYAAPTYLTKLDQTRWDTARMPLRVLIESKDGKASRKRIFREDTIRAFDAWSQATDGAIKYTIVKSAPADIVVTLLREPPPADRNGYTQVASGGASGDTFSGGIVVSPHDASSGAASGTGLMSPNNSEVNSAVHKKLDPTIHSAHVFIYRPRDSRMVFQVIVHELGHAFGIISHSNDSRDAMATGEPTLYRDHLTQRDISSIRAMYNSD